MDAAGMPPAGGSGYCSWTNTSRTRNTTWNEARWRFRGVRPAPPVHAGDGRRRARRVRPRRCTDRRNHREWHPSGLKRV